MTTIVYVEAITKMAVADFAKEVPMYHAINTGDALIDRLYEQRIRTHFVGDRKYMRSIYSAAYWLESMKTRRKETVV